MKELYVSPALESVDLTLEGPVLDFSQGEPIVTPSSRVFYLNDNDYDVE